MSYRRKTYVLEWEDGHSLAGLRVRTRGLSIEELGVISGVRGAEGDDMEKVKPLVKIFADALIDWNYESINGGVIGVSYESIMKDADMTDVMSIIDTWVGKVSNVATPLGKRSPSGNPSLEASMPMESLL